MITRWRLRPVSFQQRLPCFCSGPQASRCQFQAFKQVKSAPEPRQEIPLQLRSTSPHPGAKSPSQPQREEKPRASPLGADPACGAWRQAVPPALQWPTEMMVSPAAFREYSAESPHFFGIYSPQKLRRIYAVSAAFLLRGHQNHDDFDNASPCHLSVKGRPREHCILLG